MYIEGAATASSTGTSDGQARVAILMGTFNGERFLKEQLDSIAAQSYHHWELHISDDGSTDNTLKVLNTATDHWAENKVTIHCGPHKGFVANFLSLACSADIKADYYSFSDQDDVWEPDKLSRALEWLKSIPADVPAMYCSRTRLIDEAGRTIGFSPLFKRRPSFKNALVQSIAGANSMVFNDAARQLLAKAGHEILVASHDWWVYMIVTGCGGTVLYNPIPSIGYRQHEKNLVGSNNNLRARISRLKASFKGRFKSWNDMNLKGLGTIYEQLDEESQQVLSTFSQARQRKTKDRVKGILSSGVYRQTFPGNISLMVAALTNKL